MEFNSVFVGPALLAPPVNGMAELASPGHIIVLFVIGAGLYFIPTLLAAIRKVTNHWGVFLLNLLLGWTVIGWVAALIWAVVGQTDVQLRDSQIDYQKLAAAMKAQQTPPH